jgi:hypothetical protein
MINAGRKLKYQITIHQNPFHFEIKTHGIAEVSGFKSFLNEILNHPQWALGSSVLFDHRDLNWKLFRTDEVRSVSNIVIDQKEKIGKGKWAFVISGNFGYGMARMWQIITEEKAPMEINIFKEREKAIEWLFNGMMEENPVAGIEVQARKGA